jgi:hypothetical protein
MPDLGKNVVAGAVGGIIGATVMTLILIGSKVVMGLPPLADFMVMGTFVRGGIVGGFVAHYLVGVVDGAIFAALVATVPALKLGSWGKALGLGLLFGVIVYVIVFIPIAFTGFAPIMMAMMGPGAAAMMPTVLALALVEHLLFGLIVGFTTYGWTRGE